jgi:hypothetical protein
MRTLPDRLVGGKRSGGEADDELVVPDLGGQARQHVRLGLDRELLAAGLLDRQLAGAAPVDAIEAADLARLRRRRRGQRVTRGAQRRRARRQAEEPLPARGHRRSFQRGGTASLAARIRQVALSVSAM